MRTVLVSIALILLFFFVRQRIGLHARAETYDPVLIGYGTLFIAGMVASEVLRPVLGLLSGPVRFGVIAIVAGLTWTGVEYWRLAGSDPIDVQTEVVIPKLGNP